MLERFVLPIRDRNNVRMAMSNTHGDDPAKRVEISAAVLVPGVLHFPFHQHERLFVVEKDSRVEEFFAQAQHFIDRRAAVFFWLVTERRKVGEIHIITLRYRLPTI